MAQYGVEHLPSGVKRYYGSADGREARVVNELGTHRWLLLKERDADGNTIEYGYHHLEGEAGQHREELRSAQALPLLRSVRWGGNEVTGQPHVFRVRTERESDEGQLDMLHGHVLRTSRLTGLTVHGPHPTDPGDSEEQMYWRYTFTAESSADTGRWLLKSVQWEGHNPGLWLSGGSSERTWSFDYSGNGSLCEKENQTWSGRMRLHSSDKRVYRTGYRAGRVSTPYGIRFNVVAQGMDYNPFDSLTPEHVGQGYRFQDINADGLVDILYHPVGAGTPAARLLPYKSHQATKEGGWSPVVRPRLVYGIPGTRFISSLADINGDAAVDAVTFPVYWTDPNDDSPAEGHYDYEDSELFPDDMGVDRMRELLEAATAGPEAHDPRKPIFCGPALEVNANSGGYASIFGLIPPDFRGRIPGLDGYTPGLDGHPASIQYLEDLRKAICPPVAWDPWFNAPNPLDADLPVRGTVSEGRVRIKIDRNQSRGQLETDYYSWIEGWPNLARKQAQLQLRTSASPSGIPDDDDGIGSVFRGTRWYRQMVQASDFHAPMTDVNGDGMSDIVLLKSMDTFVGRPQYQYVPRIFLSNGAGFRPVRRDRSLIFDITKLISRSALPIGGLIWRTYRNSTRLRMQSLQSRPVSDGLREGIVQTLAPDNRLFGRMLLQDIEAAPLRSERRTQLVGDLVALADTDMEATHGPPPMIALDELLKQGMRAFDAPSFFGWFPVWNGFDISDVPSTPIDVSPGLLMDGDRVMISLGDLLRLPDLSDAANTAIRDFGSLVSGLDDILPSTPPWVRDIFDRDRHRRENFTTTAIDILKAGSDTACSGGRRDDCNAEGTYPQSVNFNSMLMDLNGDRLPELVTATRPVRPTPESLLCLEGHQVHFNRGYRWDTFEEAQQSVTVDAERWSSTAADSNAALTRLRNRNARCNDGHQATLSKSDEGLTRERQHEFLPSSLSTFADVNGDGLTDLVFAAVMDDEDYNEGPYRQGLLQPVGVSGRLLQEIHLNTGRGFEPAPTGRDGLSCGLPDDMVFGQYVGTASRATFKGLAEDGVGFPDAARLVDIDNDGMVDVAYRGLCEGGVLSMQDCGEARWRKNLRKVPDLLTEVKETGGSQIEVDYIAGTSREALTAETYNGRSTHRPVVVRRTGHLPTGKQVVREIRRARGGQGGQWSQLGGSEVERIELLYDNYVREEGRSGAVGFETVTTRFFNSFEGNERESLVTTTTYDVRGVVEGSPIPHPLKGASVTSVTEDKISGTRLVTEYEYEISAPQNWREQAVRIRSKRQTTKETRGGQSIETSTVSEDFDGFGYPRTILSGQSHEGSRPDPSHPETLQTNVAYDHHLSTWQLGRTASEEVYGLQQGLSDDLTGTGLLSRSQWSFDPRTGRLSSTTALVDSNDCEGRSSSRTTQFFYNTLGQVERVNDEGRVTEFGYGPFSLHRTSQSTTVPAGEWGPGGTLATSVAHDLRFASVRRSTDANGHSVRSAFDARGRLLHRIGPDDALLVAHTYADSMRSPSIVRTTTYTDRDASFESTAVLDGAGNVLASVREDRDGFVRSSHNRLDAFGQVRQSYLPVRVSGPERFGLGGGELSTKYSYNGLGETLETVLPGKRTTTVSRTIVEVEDETYHQVTTTNPRGFNTVRRYDSRDQLTLVDRHGQGQEVLASFRYERDGLGRLVRVHDEESVRKLQYNEAGLLIAATLPHRGGTQNVGAHTYCYNDFGELESAETIAGRQVAIYLDPIGRPYRVETDYEDEISVRSMRYDCSAEGNSLGRLCSTEDPSGFTQVTYDDYGRQDSFTLDLSAEVAEDLPAGLSSSYSGWMSYGLGGQLKFVHYEGLGDEGHAIDMRHDAQGRTTDVTAFIGQTWFVDGTPSHSSGAGTPIVDGSRFDEAGRLTGVTLGNGVQLSRRFDRATGFLTGVSFARRSQQFASLQYPLNAYDPNGNPWLEQRLVGGREVSRKEHTFDPLDRLETSKLTMDGSTRAAESYFYSGTGNIEEVQTRGTTQTYVYERGDNLQAVTGIVSGGPVRELRYDDDGWLRSDTRFERGDEVESRSLEFDAAGCLRRVERTTGAATTAEITRNICGHGSKRVLREVQDPDGRTERTYYLPGNVELRLSDDASQALFTMRLPVADTTVAQLAWSVDTGELVESESGYVHSDLRGSTLARTGLNDADPIELVREAEYGAWGETQRYAGIEAPRYGFTGEEPDPGTGYYQFGARAYDPTLRRWLSPDPLVLGVPEVDANVGTQLNLYQYAANNPVTVVDPEGQFGFAVLVAVAVAVLDVALTPARENSTNIDGGLGETALNAATGHGASNLVGAGAKLVTRKMAGRAAVQAGTNTAAHTGSEMVEAGARASRGGARGTTRAAAQETTESTTREASRGTTRVRHYTNSKGQQGIKESGSIKATDQNKVFAEPAKGKPLSPRDAEAKYGLKRGRGRRIVETDVPADRVKRVKNPQTKVDELQIEGDVPLQNPSYPR